jgi:hypothetical protein
MKYEIYCDESCHVMNDGFNTMAIGGVFFPAEMREEIKKEIRNLKMKHGIKSSTEIKWTKVSENKFDFYSELIEYFFSKENLGFRVIVVKNKKSLDHEKYHQTHNSFYSKMYYLLLSRKHFGRSFDAFFDVKDTHGGPRISKMKKYLLNQNTGIGLTEQINSSDSDILQLADVLVGAVTYYHRYIDKPKTENKNAKKKIVNQIFNHGVNFAKKTNPQESKFNLFIWEPNYGHN